MSNRGDTGSVRTYYHGSPRGDLDQSGLRAGSYITDDVVWASMHGRNLYLVRVSNTHPVMQYWRRDLDGADVIIVEREVPADQIQKVRRPWLSPRFLMYELRNLRDGQSL